MTSSDDPGPGSITARSGPMYVLRLCKYQLRWNDESQNPFTLSLATAEEDAKKITRYIEALKRRPASLRLLEWKRVIMGPGLDRGPDSAVLTY